jgi:hypothetical protein
MTATSLQEPGGNSRRPIEASIALATNTVKQVLWVMLQVQLTKSAEIDVLLL